MTTINQSQLIKDISQAEGIKESTVRQIFKSAEDKIFDYLSSATQSECVEIFPLKGFKIFSRFTKPGMSRLTNEYFDSRLKVDSKITKRYDQKLNEYIKWTATM